MNKKGQLGWGFAIVMMISLFLIGMLNINFIKDEVTRARNSANLDCSNSDISDGTKVLCLVVDIVVPYFIILVFSFAGGILAKKLIF